MPQAGSQQNQQPTQPARANANERRAAAALKKERGQDRMNQRRGSEPVEDVSGDTQVNTQKSEDPSLGEYVGSRVGERVGEKARVTGAAKAGEEAGAKAGRKAEEFAKKVGLSKGLNKAAEKIKRGKENEKQGLSLYPIPALMGIVLLDMIDPFSGSLFGVLVVIDAVGTGIYFFYLRMQGGSAKRSGVKLLLSGLIDLFPFISILPWETFMLIGINASMQSKENRGLIGGFIANVFQLGEKITGQMKKGKKSIIKRAKNTGQALKTKFNRSQ